MADKFFYLLRSVRDTSLQEGCFYTLDELTDETNPEIADLLIQNNLAVQANYLPESAKRPNAAEPVKRTRRSRKDGYQTREMRAE